MLFKPELINKIVLGEKTQTRRPVKSAEAIHKHNGKTKIVTLPGMRKKYVVGSDYAVQPGRGASSVW